MTPSDAAGAGPLTVPGVLAAAVASDPGRPRLTWYGADGERIELSARVLLNWVAKTANLLVEELLDPPAPGVRPVVALDLPVHWRSIVWGLAASAVGAEVVDASAVAGGGLVGGGPKASGLADVVVTDTPVSAPLPRPTGAPLVVLTLAALAFATEEVPRGALDYNAVVAGHGDDLPAGAPALPLDVAGPDIAGPDIAPPPAGAALPDVDPTPRVLLDAAGTSITDALRAVVTALSADGSVVLRGPGAPDARHLAEVERVTTPAP